MNRTAKQFLGKTVRVAALHWIPWLQLAFNGDGHGREDLNMSGPMANLLNLLADKLGFNYTVYSPEDGQWGVPLPNGDWSGMVGMVHNNRADLALGPIVMTYGRSRVTTFSSQVTTDYLTILAGFPNVIQASIFGTLMAFEWQVWMALVCSLLGCVFTASMVDIVTRKEKRPPARDLLLKNWWLYFSALFCEAAPRMPRNIASRIVFAVWWLTVVVLMNAFTGHMKATMMVRPEPDRIDSMKELAEREHMKTFIWKGTAYESLLRNSRNVPEYQSVWHMVEKSNGTFDTNSLYSESNLIAVQRGEAVIVSDATTMRFHVATNCRQLRHGTFYFSREQFFPHKFAVALNRNEDPTFVVALNQRISWMLESGLVEAWMEEQYGDWETCSSGSGDDAYSPLSLFEVQSVFIIYLMFSACSATAFVFELLLAGLLSMKKKSSVRILVTADPNAWRRASHTFANTPRPRLFLR